METALREAQRIGDFASKKGFDWPDLHGPRGKVDEELLELDDAIHRAHTGHIKEELGDLLFSIVNVARHLGIDAEDCLAAATQKFRCRFERLQQHVEATGGDPNRLSGEGLEDLWQSLKGEACS